jgi:hypothetical protein
MKSLRLRLLGKTDRNGDDYYFTTTHVPVHIDLSNTVIHVYPDEESEEKFGAEMVIRHYDPRSNRQEEGKPSSLKRRRRSRRGTTEAESEPDIIAVDEEEEQEPEQ